MAHLTASSRTCTFTLQPLQAQMCLATLIRLVFLSNTLVKFNTFSRNMFIGVDIHDSFDGLSVANVNLCFT